VVTAFLTEHRRGATFVAALLVPFAVAGALVPFRGTFANTAAALVLVAVVVALAVVGDRLSGVTASIFGAFWFDFFLTRPYDRLAISHRPDLETTISLLVVGVIVTELAARNRHHSRVSSEESTYVSMLRELSELAAGSSTSEVVIDSVERSLVPLLDLRACRFDVALADPPLARVEARGGVNHVGHDWPVREIGIPGPEAEIVIEWRGRAFGRFVLTPTPGHPVTLERRVVAVLLVRVVAAAMATETPEASTSRIVTTRERARVEPTGKD